MNLKGLNENLLYTIFSIVNVSVHLSHGLKKPSKMAKIIFFFELKIGELRQNEDKMLTRSGKWLEMKSGTQELQELIGFFHDSTIKDSMEQRNESFVLVKWFCNLMMYDDLEEEKTPNKNDQKS